MKLCILSVFFVFIFLLYIIFLVSILAINKADSIMGDEDKVKKIGVTKDNYFEKLFTLLSSFGFACFLVAHLWFIPIAERMMVNHEKKKDKTEKSEKFGKKDISIPRRSIGFPRRKVFAT
jgi:hypothetical protein